MQKLLTLVSLCCLSGLCLAAAPQITLSFEVQGLDKNALENTTTALKVERDSYPQPLTEQAVENIYAHAPDDIRKAIAPYGYFKPKIQGHLLQQNGHWVAKFSIQPGPLLRVKKLDLQILGPGKSDPVMQQALQNFRLQPGRVFKTNAFNKAKENLFLSAQNQGYIKAAFVTSKVLIDLKAYSAIIIMHLDTGPRYYFGEVHFTDSAYAQSFLQRFIHFKENTPFSSKKLIKLQQDMSSSFYFRRVIITPDFKDITNYHVPIQVTAEEEKSQRYNFGIGYGTFTGFRLTAGASFRRLTDTGQHFDLQMRLSSVLSGLAAKYYIPGADPINDQWWLGADYQRFVPKNGNSVSRTVSAGYMHKWRDFHASITGNYLVERYKAQYQRTQTHSLLYPSLNVSYTKADDFIKPTTGKSFNAILRGASKAIKSSTSFSQADLKAKYLFTPFPFAQVVVHGEFGYTAVKDLKKLPLSLRFFAGGLNSIRGYGDSSIGPGKYLQVVSIEYRNRIKGNWQGAAFYDFGNATNHLNMNYYKSVGLGVIYQSAIGPVKFYVARAINRPEHPYGIEFSIGPEF